MNLTGSKSDFGFFPDMFREEDIWKSFLLPDVVVNSYVSFAIEFPYIC